MTRFTKLPQMMKDTLASMKIINNVPEEMAIQAVLGIANFAAQAYYNIDPVFFGGNEIPLSLYFLGLAPTGAIKSTTYKMLDPGIKRFEEDEKLRLGDELARYELEKVMYDKAFKAKTKDITEIDRMNPNTMAKLAKELKEPVKPRSYDYRISTGTVNGIIDTLARQPFAGMFSSEAGDFFNSHAFQNGLNSGAANQMLTTLTNLWDGHEIRRNTGLDKTKITDRRFNMLFLLQAAMAEDWLTNPLYSDQGFVHRLLITQTDNWEVPELDVSRLSLIKKAEKELMPFHNRIYKLLSKPLPFKEINGELSEHELAPTTLTIENSALDLLAKFTNSITPLRKTKYKEYDGFVARVYEQACRIAGTLAVFEEKTFVDLDSAAAAVELMEFYLEERLKLDLGSRSKNSMQIEIAKKVKAFIENLGGLVKHNDMTKRGPKCYRTLSVEERKGVIHELISRGEIALVEKDNSIQYQII
jgi:Protein of unknown function (DUF3987)